MDAANAKLKEFCENMFDIDGLFEAGLFEQGTRRDDYKKIADRICKFFGYQSIYEYKHLCDGRNCDGDCHAQMTRKDCRSYKAKNQLAMTDGWQPVIVNEFELRTKDSILN